VWRGIQLRCWQKCIKTDDEKSEIRSTKFETNSNDRNSKVKNFAAEGAERKSKIKKQNDRAKLKNRKSGGKKRVGREKAQKEIKINYGGLRRKQREFN